MIDETWRIFTVAIVALLAIAAAMLLVSRPDTGRKPGGEIIGGGAVDLRATHRAIRGENDLRP